MLAACLPAGPAAARAAAPARRVHRAAACAHPRAMWTRPTPDRDQDFIKPSYVPGPRTTPMYEPRREQETYKPAPEFRPADQPEKPAELPSSPKMPERRPDPIPAGNPKKKEAPPRREEQREAPPPKPGQEPQTQ